jgi:hypothetical protein
MLVFVEDPAIASARPETSGWGNAIALLPQPPRLRALPVA